MLRAKHTSVVFFLVVGLSAAAGAQHDAPQAPKPREADRPYKLSDGPHRLAVVDEVVLHDGKRNKDLALKIRCPAEPGKYPVIIFSHGAGGSKDGNADVTSHWAGHGYVCILPTHDDSIVLRRSRGEEMDLQGVVRSALTDPEGWVNRPRDVSFIIDSLDELERTCPELNGRMDRERIGVAGHSYGAYTAQVIGGASPTVPGRGKLTLRDDRVRAVLLFSPQGAGQMGLTPNSWDTMTLPMMSLTGTYDRGAMGQEPDWRMQPYNASPPGDKYHVFIEGASHFTFGGRLVRTARQRIIFDCVKISAVAFWDACLKDDPTARDYLASDALETHSRGLVKLHRK